MSSKTLLIESNNTASKIYTNRQLRKGVIGSQNIKKANSQWRTDLKFGINVEPGDEITISGTQINLRGEPNSSMEFSGSLNSEYEEENSLLDNVSTVEYGYYFTNNKQYNFNLPMSRHAVVGGTRWWKRDFGLWGGENPVPEFTKGWEAFARSFPAWGIEGCYKAVESQPGDAGAKQVNTVTRWQVIDVEGEIAAKKLPPSLGRQNCGRFTEVAISNGPFSISHSNEKRLYLLSDFESYTSDEKLTGEDFVTNSTDILKSDNVVLSAPVGFQTPSSVAQGLTEQLHQRKGEADNWTNEFDESEIYLHDAQFYLVSTVLPGGSANFIDNGGYDWKVDTKLNKYPVSQVTDKMLKTIRTAGGDLLDAIVNKRPGWEVFNADIPGNPGWRKSIDVGETGSDQNANGTWNNLPHIPGDFSQLGPDSYTVAGGKSIYYKNLLCGEIGRHNSLATLNQLVSGNGINNKSLCQLMFAKHIPNWNELFSNRDITKKAFYNNTLYSDLAFINEGAVINYAMGPSNWDPAAPPSDGTKAAQFGAQKIVSTDYFGVVTGDETTQSPALVERDYPAIIADQNLDRTGNGLDSHFNAETSGFCLKQSENMVWPTNIVATPRSIAQLKKALYASRKSKNFGPEQEIGGSGKVRNDCKNENIAKLDVAELDYYFLDDGATVNTNSPDGYADPKGLTGKYALPCAFACANCEGLGGRANFDANFLGQHPNYKQNTFEGGTLNISPPTEPFQYTSPLTGAQSNPKRIQPSMRQGSRNNRLNFKTVWDDKFEKKIDWVDREGDGSGPSGIYLNPISIFKFTDDDGKEFQHKEWFEPQNPNYPLFADDSETGRYDLWDEQEANMDNGVALCVVYYKRMGGSAGVPDETDTQVLNNYPAVAPQFNPDIRLGFPGCPLDEALTDEEVKLFYNTPFLALIMNKAEKKGSIDDTDPLREYFIAPMIGENFGISPSFSDGEYAKIVNTQRANPKAYNTITNELEATDSNYGNFCSRHNPLYYNLYDYVPYVMIGAQDPNVQFGGTSGRFEIADLHTPLYVGNGSWNDVADEDDSPAGQAAEKIASLNNKLAWTTTMTWTTNLRGATIENSTQSTGNNSTREGGPGVDYVKGNNQLPSQGPLNEPGFDFQTNLHGLPVIPWGELQQDSNEHKVVTSQSGVGILNIFVPYANQDLNTYKQNVENHNSPYHERMSPWFPNTFQDTLLHKCGYEIEQLIPMVISCQSNSFNRSNYNKFIGYDGQLLYQKQSNMVYPFTTNGYVSGPINIQGQNRNWVGYDTIYSIPALASGSSYGWGTFPDTIGIMDDRGNSSSTLRKILPAGGIYDMYSMGGLNYLTGTQVTIESDVLVASQQPKKFDYSYLVIYSNIIEQQSNFYGSNKTLPLPAVGYLNRNYSSSDFFYSFVSDFKYVADREHVINNFDIEIRLPNGKLANLEDNSSIIFKVIKPAVLPPQIQPPKPPTKKELTKEERETELYYKSLIG